MVCFLVLVLSSYFIVAFTILHVELKSFSIPFLLCHTVSTYKAAQYIAAKRFMMCLSVGRIVIAALAGTECMISNAMYLQSMDVIHIKKVDTIKH